MPDVRLQPPIVDHIRTMVRIAPKAMDSIVRGEVVFGDLRFYYDDPGAAGTPCGCLIGAEAVAIRLRYPETMGVPHNPLGDAAEDLARPVGALDPPALLDLTVDDFAAIGEGVVWEVDEWGDQHAVKRELERLIMQELGAELALA